MVNSPDVAVLKRVAEGENEALASLYDRYAPVVNGIARRILRDAGDAEDVVQTVFLQVWRQAGRYDAQRGTVAAPWTTWTSAFWRSSTRSWPRTPTSTSATN